MKVNEMLVSARIAPLLYAELLLKLVGFIENKYNIVTCVNCTAITAVQ